MWALALLALGGSALAPAPANDLLLRTALGQKTDKTPVWLFRQAGRHMEEYTAYKAKTGKHFLQLLEDPADVAEVTMQPLRRYDVDAAILFSDILVVPQALGIKVEMPGGVGILVPEPVTEGCDAEYIAKLASFDPAWIVQTQLKHVTEAVSAIRAKQLEEGRDMTLIGFSAAPWTLLFYTVGGSSKNTAPGLAFARRFPEETAQLLDGYTDLVVEYLSAQLAAGAHCLQLFEAMGMTLDAPNFEALAMPRLREVAARLKLRHPGVPLLVFARGVAEPLAVNLQLREAGFDVITIDTVAERKPTRDALSGVCLQGNFDPKFLRSDTEAQYAAADVDREVESMLTELGANGLIANLGEGLMGKEDQALVKRFVDSIHETSAKML